MNLNDNIVKKNVLQSRSFEKNYICYKDEEKYRNL